MMLCINNQRTDTGFNLAAELYLLKNVENDVFMVWQNEPSVIVGKHQNIEWEVNTEYARSENIKVVRRHSGGGCVYHDLGNINLTFIQTAAQPDFDRYLETTRQLLLSLGIPAEPDSRRGLYVAGKKISGSAQFIRKNRVLYHATLLFDADLSHLEAILDTPVNRERGQVASDGPEGTAKKWVRSVISPVTNLKHYIHPSMSLTTFKHYIFQSMLNSDTANREYRFTASDLSAIEQINNQTYIH